MEETGSGASPTPILDRQTPLPRAVGSRTRLRVLLIAGGIGALLGVGLASGPAFLRRVPPGSWLQDLFEQSLLRAWLILISALGVAALLQLGATLLAARCAGFHRVRSRFRLQQFGGSLRSILEGLRSLPGSDERLASRLRWVLISGPAANVLFGCVVLLLPHGAVLGSIAFLFLVIGFLALIPFPDRSRPSVGDLLWRLRDRARAGRMLAQLQLARECEEGVLPEALSPRLLEEATAIRDETPETVHAHALAYSSAYYRRDPDSARFLETCLRFSATAAPAMREALMSNAAVCQARQRGRVDLAEQWLADMPAKPLVPWMRTRVEAALLEARGDREGALGKLEEVERGIHASLRGPALERQLVLEKRWKAEIRGRSELGSPSVK